MPNPFFTDEFISSSFPLHQYNLRLLMLTSTSFQCTRKWFRVSLQVIASLPETRIEARCPRLHISRWFFSWLHGVNILLVCSFAPWESALIQPPVGGDLLLFFFGYAKIHLVPWPASRFSSTTTSWVNIFVDTRLLLATRMWMLSYPQCQKLLL